MQIDDIREGYFKLRLRAKGPWVPVHVWLEDGERDPETWELLSDQLFKAEWAPQANSPRFYPVPWQGLLNRLHPISKDEFQWLIALRTIPSHPPSRKPLCK